MSASANAKYLLHEFERLSGTEAKGLDYGCGEGRLIARALESGIDFWGAEAYYGDPERWAVDVGGRTMPAVRERIRLLGPGFSMPFADAEFDFVCSDQVIEHVTDLDATVDELARVTKPGGWNVHIFPTKERVFEAHLRVPYFHRLPRALRRPHARLFHRVRIASYTSELPSFERWFAVRNAFFDENVHLRSAVVIHRAFARYFDVESAEASKLNFQRGWSLSESSWLRFTEHRRSGVTLRMRRR